MAAQKKSLARPAPTPSRRRWLLVGGALVLLAAGAFAFHQWRAARQLDLLAAAVPARPDVSHLPVEFITRLAAAETQARGGPARLAAFRELATLYHANGCLPEAGQCYEALLAADANHPRWAHRLAGIYAGYGQLETAVPLWERIFDTGYIPARLRLGDALLKLDRADEAARAYEAVIKAEPDNPYALTGLARLDLKAGRLTQARARLEQAAARSNLAIGADLLASVCEQLGDTARAAELRGRHKSSGAYFDPPDPWTDEIHGDCYDTYRLAVAAGAAAHGGDHATAGRLLERALRLAPSDDRLLLQAAFLAMRLQDLASAQSYLDRAAAASPRNSDVWAQLIELHVARNDFAAAGRALATGLANCPQSPGLRLQLARRLAAAGRIDEAIAQFRESFRLRPEEADPLIEIAQLEFQRERFEPAVAELRRALEVSPGHPVALPTLALHAIATGDERAARQWLRHCADQVRIPREQLARLQTQFAGQFGHPPD